MFQIDNIGGCTLIFTPFKGIETASLGIFINAGARCEEKSVKGIAHFMEHLLFKGSKKYSYRRIKRDIEGRGGSLNAFTSQEITCYYAHFLNKNIKITLDILLDMVMNPSLKNDDIDKERKVVLEEIKMYNDLPSSRAASLLDGLLWKGHSLGLDVVGTPSTVKAIKRKALIDFKERHYRPRNIVISLAGNFFKDEIVGLIKERLSIRSLKLKPNFFNPRPLQGISIKTERKDLEQVYLCIGFRGVSYLNPLRIPVELLSIILGANMSSRLFEEIREKRGLCYDISTEVKKYRDSGAFIIHAGLDKSNLPNAIKAIMSELNKVKAEEISLRELDRAKDFFIGQVTMEIENPRGMMFYMGENYLALGKVEVLSDVKKKVNKIGTFSIKRAAETIFKTGNICISCVGGIDKNTERDIENIL